MSETKNMVLKMKNAFDKLISRPDTIKLRINELKHRSTEITQSERGAVREEERESKKEK